MTGTFRVERSTTVDAKPEAIFPLIDDFHRWAEWSPFEKMDPNLDKTYSGAARGKGAAYAWAGKKSGSGRMEILTSDAPSRVVIQLDFTKPMVAHNTAEFTIEPQGGGSKVTWAMTGPHTLMSRAMHLVFPMDKMVGPQFAEGLASIKAIVEGASVAA